MSVLNLRAIILFYYNAKFQRFITGVPTAFSAQSTAIHPNLASTQQLLSRPVEYQSGLHGKMGLFESVRTCCITTAVHAADIMCFLLELWYNSSVPVKVFLSLNSKPRHGVETKAIYIFPVLYSLSQEKRTRTKFVSLLCQTRQFFASSLSITLAPMCLIHRASACIQGDALLQQNSLKVS